MQKELTQAKVVVEAATQDCNALLEVITTSTADVETKQAVAIAKEEELKVSNSPMLLQRNPPRTACSCLLHPCCIISQPSDCYIMGVSFCQKYMVAAQQ